MKRNGEHQQRRNAPYLEGDVPLEGKGEKGDNRGCPSLNVMADISWRWNYVN
jgi:hypothetical protein